MEELSLDNILSEDQINGLFTDDNTPEPEQDIPEVTEKQDSEEIQTTEVNPEDLFGEPESVGSDEENNKDREDTTFIEDNTSPNFYSSIANALVKDGVFQNLDENELKSIKTAEDFADFVSNQIKEQFDERQKRIDEALHLGVEPSEIQRYENYMSTLDNISVDSLSKETEDSINLRKNLIFQDYINRGVSKERALKYIERSFRAGTDIEDAKEALQSNKEYFKSQYDSLIEEAKEKEAKEKEKDLKQAEEFRTSILESNKAFGEIELDKATRQKVYDSIMKPIYTDPETGEKLTAIQKYEMENKTDFLKNIGLVYVLTDGFKKLDGLVQGKVKKELKRSLRELEHTINNTSRHSDGSLSFMSGVADPYSRSSKWDIDI